MTPQRQKKNPWDDFQPVARNPRRERKERLAPFLVPLMFTAGGAALGAVLGYLYPIWSTPRHRRVEAWAMTAEELGETAALRMTIGAVVVAVGVAAWLWKARRR